MDGLLQVDAESDVEDNLNDSSILLGSDAEPDHDLESSSTVIGKEKADDDIASDLRLAEEALGGDIESVGSSGEAIRAARTT